MQGVWGGTWWLWVDQVWQDEVLVEVWGIGYQHVEGSKSGARRQQGWQHLQFDSKYVIFGLAAIIGAVSVLGKPHRGQVSWGVPLCHSVEGHWQVQIVLCHHVDVTVICSWAIVASQGHAQSDLLIEVNSSSSMIGMSGDGMLGGLFIVSNVCTRLLSAVLVGFSCSIVWLLQSTMSPTLLGEQRGLLEQRMCYWLL